MHLCQPYPSEFISNLEWPSLREGLIFTSNMRSVEIVVLTPVYRRGVVVCVGQDHPTRLASLEIYDVAEYFYHIDIVCNVRYKCPVLPASR